MQIIKNKLGFTLAEILIVITIIGIIAMETIPTFVQNTQKVKEEADLKTNYNSLSRGFMSLVNDYGGSLTAMCPETGDMDLNYGCLGSKIKTYFVAIKYCAYGNAVSGGCQLNPADYTLLNGQPPSGDLYGTQPNVWLPNGASIAISWWPTLIPGGAGFIVLDTNTIKPPNQVAKDIFLFMVYGNGTVVPYSAPCIFPPNPGWNDPSNTGYGCAEKILLRQKG